MAGSLLDVAPAKMLRIGVLAAPLVCLAGIFLLTAGTDEAWIVLGVRGLVEHGSYGAESPFRSAHSTGGAYTLAAAGLHAIGGGRLEVVRLVSALSLAGLLFLVWKWSCRLLEERSFAPWIVCAALLAIPGTFMLGSQAYGEILAALLVVAGAFLWGAAPGGSWERRLWTGAILGTAAATRLNCIVALAALPLAATLNRGRRRPELVDAGIATAVGAAVFAIQAKLLLWNSVDPETVGKSLQTSGLTMESGFNPAYLIPLVLDYWNVLQSYLPFVAVAAVVVGWAWARPRVTAPQGPDVLLIFSVLMWGAWLAKAPIPHLRYLWPGLAGFAIVGGIVLALISRRLLQADTTWARSGVAWVAVALLISGYVDAARTYQHGESDILSWQWHRAAPQRIEFGPLRALKSQKSFVRRLNELPKDQVVATIGFDTALTLLTRRSIIPAEAYYPQILRFELQPVRVPEGVKPRWLAVTPFVDRFPNGRMTPVLHRWIEQNCRFDCRFGPYVLYEVTGPYPESPDVLALQDWAARLPLVPAPQHRR